MRSVRILSAVLVAAVVLVAGAQSAHAQADYFPMSSGDQWTYRNTRFGGDRTVEVTRNIPVSWGTVGVLDNYWGDGRERIMALFQNDIYDYDSATGRFFRSYVLDGAVGDSYNLRVAPPQSCLDGSQASVVSTTETVTVPAGTFQNCLVITYRNTVCADAGVIAETFAPGVGLIRRVENNFAGPVEQVLTAATVGGRTFPAPASSSGLSACLSIDSFSYHENRMPVIGPNPRPTPKMTATLEVKNETTEAIDFVFTSGQSFDIVITERAGRELFRWSDGRFFTQAIRQITLAPGDTFRFTEVIDLGGMVDGDHKVEFFLSGSPQLGGSATFRKFTTF